VGSENSSSCSAWGDRHAVGDELESTRVELGNQVVGLGEHAFDAADAHALQDHTRDLGASPVSPREASP
jgi:hypothetical protein